MGAPIRTLRVMLSSRNRDLIPDGAGAVALEAVRRGLKEELEQERFCGHQLVEVWINEEAGAEDGTGDTWDQCLHQIDRADIVVSIYNGRAGWTKEADGVGICHGELERVWSRAPAKLRLIWLDFPTNWDLGLIDPAEVAESTAANRAFKQYLERVGLFRGGATDRASLQGQVRLAVAKAITELATTGSREARKGTYYLGSPLDWARLGYAERRVALERTVGNFLETVKRGQPAVAGASGAVLTLNGASVLVLVHGVPSGFGQAEARELVGRPFLRDHSSPVVAPDASLIGPVHIVACLKTCTEPQLIAFMGHPDVFIVAPPFGFMVVDRITFVQAMVLVNCRDETSTRVACQRMFDWLEQSGELSSLVGRARSRTRILQAMAAEVAKAAGMTPRPVMRPAPGVRVTRRKGSRRAR